jgi:hypothetical protein
MQRGGPQQSRKRWALPFVALVASLPTLAACKGSDRPSPLIGAPGARCTPGTDAANFGCSTDKAQELACDPATRELNVYSACRGPKGCTTDGSGVSCDTSLARIDEPCRPTEAHACDVDGGYELRCSSQLAWTTHKECTFGGCRVQANTIFCD